MAGSRRGTPADASAAARSCAERTVSRVSCSVLPRTAEGRAHSLRRLPVDGGPALPRDRDLVGAAADGHDGLLRGTAVVVEDEHDVAVWVLPGDRVTAVDVDSH